MIATDTTKAFFTTSIGAKVLMAVSGLFLGLFIVSHLAGNLTAYAGAETFNAYANGLREHPALLWGARLGLIASFAVHIYAAVVTIRWNQEARPIAYATPSRTPASVAGRSMALTGFMVLAFLAYHLAHLTWHLTGPVQFTGDRYALLVHGFQVPSIALLYVVAQLLLAAHLSHGFRSIWTHLGFTGTFLTRHGKRVADLLAYGICAAFASIPVAVLLGVIR